MRFDRYRSVQETVQVSEIGIGAHFFHHEVKLFWRDIHMDEGVPRVVDIQAPMPRSIFWPRVHITFLRRKGFQVYKLAMIGDVDRMRAHLDTFLLWKFTDVRSHTAKATGLPMEFRVAEEGVKKRLEFVRKILSSCSRKL
jgi:hypothetical protein